MIEIPRSRLTGLHSADPKVFKRFLLGGFRGMFEEQKGRHAFGEAAPYIGNNSDITDDLQDIHDCLEAAEQLAFQAGAIEALASTIHSPSTSAFGTALSLITLAGKIGATDLLSTLPKVIRALNATLSDEQVVQLNLAAFEAAVSVAIPTPETKSCLLALIGIANLPARLSYPALLALCMADPSGLEEYLGLLWPQLDAMFGWATSASEEDRRFRAREMMIAEVFRKVTPEDFIKTLTPRLRTRKAAPAMPADWTEASDWWSETLTSGSQAMVEILAACSEEPVESLWTSDQSREGQQQVDFEQYANECDVSDLPDLPTYMIADIYRHEAAHQRKSL